MRTISVLTLVALAAAAVPTPGISQKAPLVGGIGELQMLPAEQAALARYLAQNPTLRPASTADYRTWAEDRKWIWESYSNRHPYYVQADLNRDRMQDFALILVDRSVRRNARGEQFNCNLVIFNRLRDGSFAVAHVGRGVGAPKGAVLFYDAAERQLAVGKWEGGVALVRSRSNGSYYLDRGP